MDRAGAEAEMLLEREEVKDAAIPLVNFPDQALLGTWREKTMKKVLLLSAAALLLLAMAFPVSANPARAIPPGEDIVAFFVDQGVDAQYVGAPKDSVPEDVWKKMVGLIEKCKACDTKDTRAAAIKRFACPHCRLNSLVMAELYAASTKLYDPVKMEIGGNVWVIQLGHKGDKGWVKKD